MKSFTIKIVSILLSVITVSCGTTTIITGNKVAADIYVNGVNLGKREVYIQRMGIPKKINIVAKYQGKEIGSTSEKRHFDGATFCVGYLTTIGFLTAWRFPKQIVIPISHFDSENYINQWTSPQGNEWMQALHKKK